MFIVCSNILKRLEIFKLLRCCSTILRVKFLDNIYCKTGQRNYDKGKKEKKKLKDVNIAGSRCRDRKGFFLTYPRWKTRIVSTIKRVLNICKSRLKSFTPCPLIKKKQPRRYLKIVQLSIALQT